MDWWSNAKNGWKNRISERLHSLQWCNFIWWFSEGMNLPPTDNFVRLVKTKKSNYGFST
jgi:hypothetical protein